MATLANLGGTGPPDATARHNSRAGAAGAGFAPLAGTPGAFGGAGDSRMAAGAGCNATNPAHGVAASFGAPGAYGRPGEGQWATGAGYGAPAGPAGAFGGAVGVWTATSADHDAMNLAQGGATGFGAPGRPRGPVIVWRMQAQLKYSSGAHTIINQGICQGK